MTIKPEPALNLPHRLENPGLVQLSGRDALSFAQSQFANDVTQLADGQWQWNLWLSAKGRVLALFALVRLDAQTLLLWLPDEAGKGMFVEYDSVERIDEYATLFDYIREDTELVEILRNWDGQQIRGEDGRATTPAVGLFQTWLDVMVQDVLRDDSAPIPPAILYNRISRAAQMLHNALLGERAGVPQKTASQRPGVTVRSTRLRKAWWMLTHATPPSRKVSAKPRLRL